MKNAQQNHSGHGFHGERGFLPRSTPRNIRATITSKLGTEETRKEWRKENSSTYRWRWSGETQ
jgi:hypothetical protein